MDAIETRTSSPYPGGGEDEPQTDAGPSLTEQLRQYAGAMADPTRGTILFELDQAGELTATQLAARLDMPANNIYHHMRVLVRLGVIEKTRIVPGNTYVEKYYAIKQELRATLRLDPSWLERIERTLTPEDL